MKLITFKEQNIVIAENQPEYMPLPAYVYHKDPQGRIACCWKLDWKERLRILFAGVIWHQILTFKQPLQPQLLTIEKPIML